MEDTDIEENDVSLYESDFHPEKTPSHSENDVTEERQNHNTIRKKSSNKTVNNHKKNGKQITNDLTPTFTS